MNDVTTVIGIDLGTTYSCVAYADENGNPVVVKNREGANTTPSVVHFDLDDPTLWDAGQVAKDNALIDPERTASFVKRIIGTTPIAITVDGKDYSPEEISAFVLKKVAGDAAVGMPMRYDGCAITVPAYFGDAENNATLAAAEIAGLNVYGLVQEPVAAAINYGCDRTDQDEVVAVYDLGGGTFDTSVVSITHVGDITHIDVVCNDGDKLLGGGNWDAEVISYLQEEFIEATGFEDDFDEYARQSLQIEAEKLKVQLSNKPQATAVLNFTGKPAKITLSRETFDEITDVHLSRTIDIMHACLDNARSKGAVPTKILLVGGSTKMPQVQERLKHEYPDLEIESNEPDEAVAKGAVRFALQQAAFIINNSKSAAGTQGEADGDSQIMGTAIDGVSTLPSDSNKVKVIDQITGEEVEQAKVSDNNIVAVLGSAAAPSIEIRTVTSKSYGVAAKDQSTGQMMVRNIILKNQPIATDGGVFEQTRRFGTEEANQNNVAVKVYENDIESDVTDIDSEPIAEATIDLEGLNLPALSPIDVTFCLSSQGILDVTAVEPSSGHRCNITLEVSGGLTKEQIQAARSASSAMTMLV